MLDLVLWIKQWLQVCIGWQAYRDSCHMVGTGIIPSIKSKEIASFFKSTPLHLYLFLSFFSLSRLRSFQTKLFPPPEITWGLCGSDSGVCVCVCAKMRFGLKQADISSLASTKSNELVAWTGVVSHQLRHIFVKNK